jgi:O-antigen/teichoic acid export membrane protein
MGVLARQAIYNTLLTYGGIALGFVNVVVLYPRVLDPDEFGLTRLLISIATIAAQVAQLGVENTAIRFFPYFKDPGRKHGGFLSMLLLFGLLVGLLAVLVLGLFHEQFARWFSDRNSLYARYGLLILPLVFGEIHFLLLRSYSRSLRRTVQPTFFREFIVRLLQTTLILVQWWNPMSFGWFMTLYVGIFLLSTLGLIVDLWRSGNFRPGIAEWKLPSRLRRSMITYSTYTFSASLAGIVLGNMDQIMIGALLGDGLRHVAHYAVAFYFGSVIAAPGRALYQAALPMLAEAWKRKDMVALQQLYRRSALVQILIGGFLFLLMWMSLDDLFHLLPMEYSRGTEVAWIIGLAYVINTSVGLNTGILSMSRSYKLDAWSSIAMIGVNAVANFFLIREMGIAGAAWATMLCLLLVNGFRTWFLYRKYGLWPFQLKTIYIILLIGVLAVLFPWIGLTGDPIPDILLRTLIISVVYWSIAYAFRLGPELMYWFSKRKSVKAG